MPRINVLPKNIADLIAAGEVVERPSSVIKEFVENSIDAGATKIVIEINNGGKSYIRVTDNGCGIERADVRNAFLSHATSKISKADDLNAITTLGFRGEALASICAVSKVELLTRNASDDVGTRYVIEGGEEIFLDDAGCPIGTTLIVRDLFFNIPARLKFLKKDVQEGNYISSIVERIAVSHSAISFRLIRDGKVAFSTPGDGDLMAAVYAVFGREFTEQLIQVNSAGSGVTVSGFTVKPIAGKGSRSMQLFYINGRYVKSTLIMSALEAAYKNSMLVGKFPACVLFIDIPAETVDVNVHPAKTEVRLYDERRIFDCVYYAVLSAITADTQRPQAKFNTAEIFAKPAQKGEQLKMGDAVFAEIANCRNSAEYKPSFQITEYGNAVTGKTNVLHSSDGEKTLDFLEEEYLKPTVKTVSLQSEKQDAIVEESVSETHINLTISKYEEKSVSVTDDPADSADSTVELNKEIQFRYLGEAFSTYLIAETEGKLIMIDKHAAHERILFEKFKKEQSSCSQLMLIPVTLTLSAEEYSAITANLDLLEKAGYDVTDFGGKSVKISACPSELANENIAEIIAEIASYLAVNVRTVTPEKLDWIYHSMACRAAIKAGNYTTSYEAEHFVKEILSRDDIRYCPHGRPVLIEITRAELEKLFKRIV